MLDTGLPAHWGDIWKLSVEHLLSRSLSPTLMRSEFCADLSKTQYLLPFTSFVNFSHISMPLSWITSDPAVIK